MSSIPRAVNGTIELDTSLLVAWLRILVDGAQVVANWDTGDSNGWAYDAISFHGIASDLGLGMHRAEIQFKVRAMPTVLEAVSTQNSLPHSR